MGTTAVRCIFRNGTHSLARPTVTTTLTTSKWANRAYRFVVAREPPKLPSETHSYLLTSTSTMHDNDPEVLEREKRRNLARKPYQTSSPLDHSPGWNEHLASTSEAYVKADQDASPVHDLASRTVAHLKVREETFTSRVATDDRDEVSGPLRSAPGANGVVDIDDAYEEEIKEQEGAWTHKVKREHLEQTKTRPA